MTRFARDSKHHAGASIAIDDGRVGGHRLKAGRMAFQATWGDRSLEVGCSVRALRTVPSPHTGPVLYGMLRQLITGVPTHVRLPCAPAGTGAAAVVCAGAL